MHKIDVVPYKAQWPFLYAEQQNKIQNAFKEKDVWVNIHHIGSTSIEGLAAKPTLDILVEVKSLDFDHDILESLGYTYRGDYNLPFRKYFTIRCNKLPINMHVYEQNDAEVELNLMFRNYLRDHSDEKEAYKVLKYTLLEQEDSHQKNGQIYRGYTLGKYDFIHEILKKAGYSRQRLIISAHYKEWEAVKAFREKYFFDSYGITDPYTWTFTHADHKHLIFYEGTTFIGYAHVQFWPNNGAALRMMVVDEAKRGASYGSNFLELIERWLKHKKVQVLHTDSSPSAVSFYKKNKYVLMPFNDPDGYERSAEDTSMGKLL